MKTLTIRRFKFLATMIFVLATASFSAFAEPESEPKNIEPKNTETKEKTETVEKAEVKVLSVVTGDWNEDKQTDAAVLMKNDEEIEIYLYLANKENKQALILKKKDIAWTGAMAGTEPYLEPKKKSSSFFIHSENDAIGRNRWHRRLTIAYRDDAFLVVGYTHDDWDTLEPENTNNCDVNLLTGSGFKNKKEFKTEVQKIKLEDWTEENIPEQCRESEEEGKTLEE